jgi:hypothetical protein
VTISCRASSLAPRAKSEVSDARPRPQPVRSLRAGVPGHADGLHGPRVLAARGTCPARRARARGAGRRSEEVRARTLRANLVGRARHAAVARHCRAVERALCELHRRVTAAVAVRTPRSAAKSHGAAGAGAVGAVLDRVAHRTAGAAVRVVMQKVRAAGSRASGAPREARSAGAGPRQARLGRLARRPTRPAILGIFLEIRADGRRSRATRRPGAGADPGRADVALLARGVAVAAVARVGVRIGADEGHPYAAVHVTCRAAAHPRRARVARGARIRAAPAVSGIRGGVDAADEPSAVDVARGAGASSGDARRTRTACLAAGTAAVGVGLLVDAPEARTAVRVTGRTLAGVRRSDPRVHGAARTRPANVAARPAVRARVVRRARAGADDLARRARLADSGHAVLARRACMTARAAILRVVRGRSAHAAVPAVGAADDLAIGARSAGSRRARCSRRACFPASAAVVRIGLLVGACSLGRTIGVPGRTDTGAGDACGTRVADLPAAAAVVRVGGGVDAPGCSAGGQSGPADTCRDGRCPGGLARGTGTADHAAAATVEVVIREVDAGGRRSGAEVRRRDRASADPGGACPADRARPPANTAVGRARLQIVAAVGAGRCAHGAATDTCSAGRTRGAGGAARVAVGRIGLRVGADCPAQVGVRHGAGARARRAGRAHGTSRPASSAVAGVGLRVGARTPTIIGRGARTACAVRLGRRVTGRRHVVRRRIAPRSPTRRRCATLLRARSRAPTPARLAPSADRHTSPRRPRAARPPFARPAPSPPPSRSP